MVFSGPSINTAVSTPAKLPELAKPRTTPDSPGGSLSVEFVYRQNWRFVLRSLRRLGVPPSRVEDLTQDVFVIVSQRLADFRPDRATVQTWLFAIAFRVAKGELRRLGRERHRPPPPPPRADPAQDAVVANTEAARLLESLMTDLTEDQRAVFILTELEDTPAPEIAEMLDVNLSTVYSRQRRARQKIARALARHQARARGAVDRKERRAWNG